MVTLQKLKFEDQTKGMISGTITIIKYTHRTHIPLVHMTFTLQLLQ